MKFQVFKNGRLFEKFELCGAYLFGTNGIAIRRVQIAFENGIIECKKPSMETSGLALLWPVNGSKTLLPTTCLPDREQPYNLNLEIARAKLMQVITKREDWAFFNDTEELGEISRQAQDLFIQAIQNVGDSAKASMLADESLEKAVVFSEKLAVNQAETVFNTRVRNHGFGRGCLGCKVNPELLADARYLKKLLDMFGFMTIPVNWAQIEPEKDKYNFAGIDACIEALAKKKVVLCAGPLLCFTQEYLPKWLLESGGEFETVREAAYRFILKIISRYTGSIRMWRVISGLNIFNQFGFNFEQVLEMTRAANMAAKAANEKAFKIVEVSNPWGEYFASLPSTLPPLVYMDMIMQGGINFDAFSLLMRFDKNQADIYTRDMMQISAILDNFGAAGKPLHITEVEVPSEIVESKCDGLSGVWLKEWNQNRQEQWIDEFYKIAFSKPFVDSVTYSALADTENNNFINSGLLAKDMASKKSFRVLKNLHEAIFSR